MENRVPPKDMVVINSAVGLLVAGRVQSLQEGVDLASSIIDTGKVGEVLQHWVQVSNTNKSSTDS